MRRIDRDVARVFRDIGIVLGLIFIFSGCSDKNSAQALDANAGYGRWQIQLYGPVNTKYDVDTYIIDLFDNSEQFISDLKLQGIEVICYFSAGSSEDWREDFSQYTEADKGREMDGWAGENWLDIRSQTVRLVIKSRLELAVKKGCDGVDPDNVNGYENDTGFDLTREEQIAFNTFIAEQSHERGLLVGLKNSLELIPDLHENFDFAVNEECLEYQECAYLQEFVDSQKPVFSIEYASDQAAAEHMVEQQSVCNKAIEQGLHTLIMPLLLDDSFRQVCQ